MKIIVEINHCEECNHLSHSGSFTPGGAYPTCAHPDASDAVMEMLKPEEKQRAKEIKCRMKADPALDKYHWRYRILSFDRKIDILSIPHWCPLKNGRKL